MTKPYHDPSLKIFSLNSNKSLAEKIAAVVGIELGKCTVRQFSDGEIQMNIEESIRGDHVYIIQSTSNPVNDYLWELLIMIDALKRASAKTINVIMPYYGYARQDRTAKPREPITAKLVANMLVKAGATRLLTLDLHAVQVQGFFDIPVDNLFTLPLLAKYYREKGLQGDEVVVVSPKNSGVSRAREISEYLGTTLAIVDQHSQEDSKAEDYIIGDVAGKKCIMIDDMINTGTTLVIAAEALKAGGATEIYVGASHGLFSANALEILEKSSIQEICVTDSIYHSPDQLLDKIITITCSELMGTAIQRIHENKPMSPLFKL